MARFVISEDLKLDLHHPNGVVEDLGRAPAGAKNELLHWVVAGQANLFDTIEMNEGSFVVLPPMSDLLPSNLQPPATVFPS